MIRKFVLLFAILVLFAGQALASEAVIEQLRLKVPESQVQIWLEAEQKTWQPWLEQQDGFLGRDIAAERDFSEETAAMIDKEVSELVDVAYKRATKVLADNRAVLDELAEMLVEQETVDAEELQELLIKRDVRVAEYV